MLLEYVAIAILIVLTTGVAVIAIVGFVIRRI